MQDEGGNYREALTAFLVNEAESARRFPDDTEFRQALVSRNMYRFRHAFYFLSRIENSYHEKDPREFAPGAYTIEHICPQNALAHKEWRDMLELEGDEEFETLVNSLGNLTLTAYNSELSDGTFSQKKERIVGGYNHEWLVISSDVRNASCWGKGDIANRARHLADRAIEVWPRPSLESAVKEKYLQRKNSHFVGRSIQFRQLVAAGLIHPGRSSFLPVQNILQLPR